MKSSQLLKIKQQLQQLFPDLETIPHHGTLNRLLSGIDVDRIEAAQIELVRSLIGDKKFQPYLSEGCYPKTVSVAIMISVIRQCFFETLPHSPFLSRRKTEYS